MTPKIKEYSLVTEHDEKRFVVAVNDLIEQGWQPFPGLTALPEYPVFYQAMVLYEENNAPLPTSPSEGEPTVS